MDQAAPTARSIQAIVALLVAAVFVMPVANAAPAPTVQQEAAGCGTETSCCAGEESQPEQVWPCCSGDQCPAPEDNLPCDCKCCPHALHAPVMIAPLFADDALFVEPSVPLLLSDRDRPEQVALGVAVRPPIA